MFVFLLLLLSKRLQIHCKKADSVEIYLHFKNCFFSLKMECTFYQFKRKIQCKECTEKEQLHPEETLNKIVVDFLENKCTRPNSTNNAFRPWSDGESF